MTTKSQIFNVPPISSLGTSLTFNRPGDASVMTTVHRGNRISSLRLPTTPASVARASRVIASLCDCDDGGRWRRFGSRYDLEGPLDHDYIALTVHPVSTVYRGVPYTVATIARRGDRIARQYFHVSHASARRLGALMLALLVSRPEPEPVNPAEARLFSLAYGFVEAHLGEPLMQASHRDELYGLLQEAFQAGRLSAQAEIQQLGARLDVMKSEARDVILALDFDPHTADWPGTDKLRQMARQEA